jgi:ribonucrease Y
MVTGFVVVIATALGLVLGWTLSRAHSRKIVEQAQAQASTLVVAARQAASLTIRESEAHAREEVQQLQQSGMALEKQIADENALIEERLRKFEARNVARESELSTKTATLQERETALVQVGDEARRIRLKAKESRYAYRRNIEEKAGETATQARDHLIESLVEETRALCADRLRNLESISSEEFFKEAKRIMGISMGRYTANLSSERLPSFLPLTPEAASKLTARPDTMSTMEEHIGIRLLLSDGNDSLRLEGGDGAARELARRVVTRFLAEERVRDLPRLVHAISADLEREIMDSGKQAFRMLGLELVHPEIVKLVGRLNYRTSYTQNQWEHSIESSFLAGLMAAELGLDPRIARRGALLHDIGKAMTHELEGSHAAIGADYARKYGEDDLITNAIGSHHADELPLSPYAYLVAAADAMSGARPGARREMVETYVDRITDLERIASHFNGVMMVHAVQAGRELRIHVDEKQVNDRRASELSDEIAKKISDELTFPGQIRITVIREFKAVEIAN